MTTNVERALEQVAAARTVLPKDVIVPSTGGELGTEIGAAATEPIYDVTTRDNIQGNVIPGFNKDYQHFLFFRIRDVARTKKWLRWLAPHVSSMDDVLTFVRAHRSLRLRLGVREPGLKATWVNVAFSSPGIAALVGEEVDSQFGEQSFRQGLAARSEYIGDPTSASQPGHRTRWRVGGPGDEADIIVIIASDDDDDLDEMVENVKGAAERSGLERLFEQRGRTLPGELRGHEHFGFKDGVSQPGVRGKVSPAPGDFITPRYLDAADPHAGLFAKPGQPLVWPGQFLLGEPRQNPQDLYASAPPATNFPTWARLGSYLVCRRLRQDVVAFWRFALEAAEEIGMSAEHFAAMLVGRWPSGAPVMRAPLADDSALAGDEFANNHFLFDDDTRPSVMRPVPGYPGDGHAQARADVLGSVCPHFAHIRKVNPRDGANDLGHPADNLLRMILRRGIPFGRPLVGVKKPPPGLVKQERGLMFLCYGSSIEDQFEFLSRRWANSPIQPNFGGHDPVIGQNGGRGGRARTITFPAPGGPVDLTLKREWVVPTGGGYFFAPTRQAIADVLGA